jgi:hypothetical protein
MNFLTHGVPAGQWKGAIQALFDLELRTYLADISDTKQKRCTWRRLTSQTSGPNMARK